MDRDSTYWREAYELLVKQTGRDLNDGLGLDPRKRLSADVSVPGPRDLWLAASGGRILEVLEYARWPVTVDGARNPGRENARLDAIREVFERHAALCGTSLYATKSEPGGIPANQEEDAMSDPDEKTQDTHETATAPVETAEVEPGEGREDAEGGDTEEGEAGEE